MKGWIIAAAVLAGLVWVTGSWPAFEAPLLFSLTPLQRYYLPAYLDSSWHKNDPFGETTVAWVWKGGAKRKDRIAVEENVEPQYLFNRMDGDTLMPFHLSGEAAAGGWTTLTNAYPLSQDSAQVESDLRGVFYDGESLGRVLFLPALTYFCALLAVWLLRVRRYLSAGTPRGLWLIEPWWVRLAIVLFGAGGAVMEGLKRAAVFLWTQATQFQERRRLERETQPRPPVPAVAVAAPMPPKPSPLPPLAVSPAPASQPVTVPGVLPLPPVAARQPKAAFVWDESKGLD